VHGFPSSQAAEPVPEQEPAEQISPIVQAFPSLHDTLLFEWTQPVAGLHESSVHTLLSLQLMLAPAVQAPPAHTSPDVHALPSLHATVLFA
jgi:hypothetical protein